MPVLDEKQRQQVQRHLSQRLEEPVTIQLFTQRASPLLTPSSVCQTCRDTEELLGELAALSDRLTLETRDLVADAEEARRIGVDSIPALVFRGRNAGTVRYLGVPAGYEFAVLLEDLALTSSGSTGLSAATREQLAALPRPVHIKVFVTPT